MTTKTSFIIVTSLVSVSVAIGLYLYPSLPAHLASHWGIDGQVNGYMPKFFAVFLLPVLMIVFSALLYWLPTIDPKKENVASFRGVYNSVIVGVISFLSYVNLLSLAWNVGYKFDMGTAIIVPLALLWYLLGVALPKTKQNWFMGVRTPWTLGSERVWKETHEFGGTLFRHSAMVTLIGLLFPPFLLWFVLIPIMFSALATIAYSYISYKREKNEHC